MGKVLTKLADWIASAILDKLNEPIEAIKVRLDGVDKRLDKLQSLHEQDAAALEADLSVMDDRICYQIGICSRRGYTTAEERRRVTRMHDAYKARGGNHGEEVEYAKFLALKTEEEYRRSKGESV